MGLLYLCSPWSAAVNCVSVVETPVFTKLQGQGGVRAAAALLDSLDQLSWYDK